MPPSGLYLNSDERSLRLTPSRKRPLKTPPPSFPLPPNQEIIKPRGHQWLLGSCRHWLSPPGGALTLSPAPFPTDTISACSTPHLDLDDFAVDDMDSYMIAMETTTGSEGSRALPSISLSPGLQRPCSSSPHSEEEDDDMEPSTVPGTPPPKKVGVRDRGASLVAPTERIRQPCRRPGFSPGVGKIPWRRAWQPTPVFVPGESQG